MRTLLMCLLLPLLASHLLIAEPKTDGQPKLWNPVQITSNGAEAKECPATFGDYQMDPTFTHKNHSLTFPEYFTANGDAANSSATSGNKWRVKFTPDAEGAWEFKVSFREGEDVAISTNPLLGKQGKLDGVNGKFKITPVDSPTPGFYSKGMLRYVGEHYLQFAGTGEDFAKAGPGSPEDFIGYEDFNGMIDNGDADTTWPWTQPEANDVYGVSKLNQRDIVFSHMNTLGINQDRYLTEQGEFYIIYSEQATEISLDLIGKKRSFQLQ